MVKYKVICQRSDYCQNKFHNQKTSRASLKTAEYFKLILNYRNCSLECLKSCCWQPMHIHLTHSICYELMKQTTMTVGKLE